MARKRKERRHLKRREFIRVASKEDCTFIRTLSGEVFSVFGEYSDIIPRWFANPDVITLVYVKNGHLVGFAMLYVPVSLEGLEANDCSLRLTTAIKIVMK